MEGRNGGQKSGAFFVILRALGFDWNTAYRTAYQAIIWSDGPKIGKVIEKLKDSKELEEISIEVQQVLKVCIPKSTGPFVSANSSRAFPWRLLQRNCRVMEK